MTFWIWEDQFRFGGMYIHSQLWWGLEQTEGIFFLKKFYRGWLAQKKSYSTILFFCPAHPVMGLGRPCPSFASARHSPGYLPWAQTGSSITARGEVELCCYLVFWVLQTWKLSQCWPGRRRVSVAQVPQKDLITGGAIEPGAHTELIVLP